MFTILAGATASWAYWTTQGSAQLTVNSANLTVSTANFSTISKTFGNEALVGTGSVTVTNSTAGSSLQKGAVTLVFNATGAATYGSNFAFVVWLSTTANPCTDAATPGTSLASGTWNASATYTTPGGSGFSVGEARTYCVRTTVNPAATWPASGAVTITPQVAASIVLGNYTGSASATATQQTQYLFPLYTPTTTAGAYFYIHRVFTTPVGNYCADLESGSGPNAIGWPCKTGGTSNQSYRFDAVAGKAGYYTIKSNITAGTVLQQNTTGAPVTAVAAVAAQVNQQWTIQKTAAGYTNGAVSRAFYQFINASTGQCLTYAAVNGTTAALNQLQMANCDGSASQQFLTVRTMFSGVNGATDTVACAYSTATTNFTINLSAATASMTYELRIGGTSVTTVTTNTSGVGTLTYARGSLAANSTTAYEVYEDTGAAGDAGTLVASGTLTRGTSALLGNSCTSTGLGT